MALSTAACASEPPASGQCDAVEVIVAASDYSSSLVCGAPCCEVSPSTTGVALGRDPQLSFSNGRAFFIAHDNELIFELDPRSGRPSAQYSVNEQGAQRSAGGPHDVAAAPDGSLWVAHYGRGQVLVLRDGEVEHAIDLSGYDKDGNPQPESVRIVTVGGTPKAFVALERLDDAERLASTRPSQMLRIDVATRQVEETFELAGRNPFNPMARM